VALSISSSSTQLPHLRWDILLITALFSALVYVAASEYLLRARGFQPTWQDSTENWVIQRARASELGGKALVLIGASRIQLGMDLPTLRRMTRLEPVMLAIDGSSIGAVFFGLADDPTFRGTVIVDVMPGSVASHGQEEGVGQHYQAAYERRKSMSGSTLPSGLVESLLTQKLRRYLANYADSARPWDVLNKRLLDAKATPGYLQTFEDRSRAADYSLVDLPRFYLRRVMRHLGDPLPFEEQFQNVELENLLTGYIRQLGPVDGVGQSAQGLRDFELAVKAIQTRGGKVLLLEMPTSGLVTEIDKRRYPRHLYWDRLVASTSAQTLTWQDQPELSGFQCPDGSHLDHRDRARFTEAVVRIAGLKRQ